MNELRDLVLVGGAGTSSDVLALIASINSKEPRYRVLGLLDDALSPGTEKFGVQVLGNLACASDFSSVGFIDCLGSPRSYHLRESILEKNGLAELEFETLVHSSVMMAEDASIDKGSILFPNVVVLSNVTVGRHVTILSGTVLNHDVVVGDWSILGSGVMLSGTVTVGNTCYLGTASSVREGVTVGDGSLVGMGAAVTKDVDSGVVVAGVPARVLRPAK